MTALDDVLSARAHLHSSTYWPAAVRAKGTNKLWLTDLDLVKAIADLQPPPPPPPPQFTKTFLNAGASIDQFIDSLTPTDVAGLGPGTYTCSPYGRSNPGWTLTSVDPKNPAVIQGRFVTAPGGDNITLRLLGMNGRTTDGSSWTIQSNHVTFDQLDLSNFNTYDAIGIMVNSSSNGFTLSNSRVHHVGKLPPTNGDHGIYDEGDNTYVIDSMFYYCADRGIQDRGGHGSLYENVTVTHCGQGIIFGDSRGAVNCTLRKSILTNPNVSSRYLIEELGSANSGNLVDDCYGFRTDGNPIVEPGIPPSAVLVQNLHNADPKLDGNLIPTLGVAQGYGCRVIPPKILSNA